jgi:hypothetical protein
MSLETELTGNFPVSTARTGSASHSRASRYMRRPNRKPITSCACNRGSPRLNGHGLHSSISSPVRFPRANDIWVSHARRKA